MTFELLDPPGMFCSYAALSDAIRGRGLKTFIDIGCGSGAISRKLCELGLSGIGVDFSEQAIALARRHMASYIEAGTYSLGAADVHRLSSDFCKADLAVSYMVMEHVADDVGFLRKISEFTKPNGTVIVAVPGRRDCWTIEDETVGHLRRYDRCDLEEVMRTAGLHDIDVRSVAVPTANLLLGVGGWLIKHSGEMAKVGQSQREQTETSGIREIPWKTTFPSWARLILNHYALWPLFVIQRLFYKTGYGVTMMGIGKVRP
ncbi:Methyltransferase domain-containing protein [Rhizobiales bacterium GAS113]|nr:Methyltransferase domain-containing protein [Rhizobiales bacterium GAS113]